MKPDKAFRVFKSKVKNMILSFRVELCLFLPNILLPNDPQALNLLVKLLDANVQLDFEFGAIDCEI